jgi:hypothetical protein
MLTAFGERVQALLTLVAYKPGSGFKLSERGAYGDRMLFLQHFQNLPDTTQSADSAHNPLIQQRGRKWYLSPWMTDGEVLQTALMAILAFEEHEAREAITFDGKRIFSPHKSVAALAAVEEEKRS